MSTGLILAIETSNPTADPGHAASVALARSSPHTLETLATIPLGNTEATGLMPCIERCFAVAGLSPRDLRAPGSRIGVSVGPGGYTSVRIAVTAAKMLAESTGALCVPVPTPLVVARSIPIDARADANGPHPFVVALASKRDTAWLVLFGPDRSELRVLGLVDHHAIDSAAHEGARTLIVDRFAPPAMLERAAALGLRVHPPRFDPLACAALTLERAPIDPLALAPVYPREPEAVTKWRALMRNPSIRP